MNPLLYWVLFGLLVCLLVVFISYIIFNVILDNCLTDSHEIQLKNSYLEKDEEADDVCRLNKYQFNKHDVEDLTRIQGDFKTALPNVTCTNEVDNSKIELLLNATESANAYNPLGSSLSNIDEEDGLKYSRDLHIDYPVTTETTDSKSFKKKKDISKSVDDLEFCDPRGIDVLKAINKIEENARVVARELDYFIGGTNNIRFYEINEKFLRLMISLCDVMCETSELQKRKNETLGYIEACQKILKEKAINML